MCILQISREYNLQVFLHENHVFTDLLQYQFEPQDNDQVLEKLNNELEPGSVSSSQNSENTSEVATA